MNMATPIGLRRHDLDNLRTFLTGLVTVHHSALVYGGIGGWPFKSKAITNPSSVLVGFNMFNQSFFMGLFFWISGRVSAQSLEKSSQPSTFLKNKILRLGVPALAYTLIAAPIVRLIAKPDLASQSISAFLWDYYSTLRDVKGSLWYPVTLLCFDAVATLLKQASNTSTEKSNEGRLDVYEKMKKYGWLAVVICNFLAKTRYPVGASLPLISLQPAYGFQYIYAYSLGYLSHGSGDRTMKGPYDPVRANTDKTNGSDVTEAAQSSTRTSLQTAVAVSILSISIMFVPRYLDTQGWPGKTTEQVFGGWNLPSLLYTLWGEVSFNLVGPALMVYFEKWYNAPANSPTWNPRYSYASFLMHEPISVAMEVLVEKVLLSEQLSSLLKSPIWQISGPIVMTLAVGLTSAWTSSFVGRKLLEWIPSLKMII